jgi:Methyltransferase domain/Rv2258c-like winged HTH domain
MPEVNQEKLHALIGKMLGDLGGAFSVPTAQIGIRLGLYDALNEHGPLTSAELAKRTGGLSERNVREWAFAQAANGYLGYDPATQRFGLSPEQAMVFVLKDSPVYLAGAFDIVGAMLESVPKVEQAFRTGSGITWGDSSGCLFCATGAFFRPGYVNSIVQSWIPALNGVEAKLKAGAKVADLGCGVGFSTLLMAEAYPQSSFVGFDFHEPSIQEARRHASTHKASKNVRFEASLAKEIGEGDFDLITVFDCLHDMGDPQCAAKMRTMLKPDGACMIVEPLAGDRPENNFNAVSRLYYNASTMICVPTSQAQEVGAALGAQAGEAKLAQMLSGGGLTRVRRATETPFNMVLEARP